MARPHVVARQDQSDGGISAPTKAIIVSMLDRALRHFLTNTRTGTRSRGHPCHTHCSYIYRACEDTTDAFRTEVHTDTIPQEQMAEMAPAKEQEQLDHTDACG